MIDLSRLDKVNCNGARRQSNGPLLPFRNQKDNLTFGHMRLVVREKLTGCTTPEFFEFFGELAGDADLPTWHDVQTGFERFCEAVSGFKKNRRFVTPCGCVQLTFALSAFDREKSSDEKFLARVSRTDARGSYPRRSRH